MQSARGSLAVFCILPVAVMSFFVACSGPHMPIDRAESVKEEGKGEGPLSFNNGIAQIFEKKCSKCHGLGGALPYWGDYSTAFGKKERIFARVVEKKPSAMPPATEPALSKEEIAQIATWIQGGAIEGEGKDAKVGTEPVPQKSPEPEPPPSASPSPAASPVAGDEVTGVPKVISYDNYVKGYFASACAMCHDGQMEGVPNWQDWDVVKANLDKIYLRFIKEKDMPMGGMNPTTYEEVTDAERELIRIWLESGAIKETVKY